MQPTRIRYSSKTLIDSIFSNTWIENTISDNLPATISDHLPQFIFLPNIFSYSLILSLIWGNFVQEHFILDYFICRLEFYN